MQQPLVFADLHHSGLLNSLIMLFEGRLGGKLYRPIGTEWHKKGFWRLAEHPATIEQYLGIGGATPDGTEPLNEVSVDTWQGVYNCYDIDSGKTNKAITFETFCRMPIDIVIASIPQHIEPFKKLISEYKPDAKLIYQVGNAWTVEDGMADNIMASAYIYNVPNHANFITYHQEFDLNIFKPSFLTQPPGYNSGKNISSFVNCFNTADLFKEDWQLFEQIEQLMPEWTFKSFGGQCRDGAAHGVKEVAQFMDNSRFVWHTKKDGDGYGHILFNTFAMGKSMIVKKFYYHDKMGADLMKDGETCICIDGLKPEEIVERIKLYSDPGLYKNMCLKAYAAFKSYVDFNSEEIKLRQFLNNLI